MATSTPVTLPIIDISPFLTSSVSSTARQDCAKELATACSTTGFFYLIGHCIPASTTDNVLSLARRFFLESSDADKARIARLNPPDGDGARGYQKIGENVTRGRKDWHEAIDFYREWDDGGAAPSDGILAGGNLWPENPKELRDVYLGYIDEVKRVGTAVVRAMGLALGLKDEEVFVNSTRNSFWVMRMIGYPGLTLSSSNRDEDLEHYSCGEHTDYGCLTLLLADSTPNALQVHPAGSEEGTWITANPIPGAFVVNIGDMMERWTNGLWKSTRHRVIHKGENFRVSVPFFFEPDWDTRVKPLEECVARSGGNSIADEVMYGDHLLGKVRGNFY